MDDASTGSPAARVKAALVDPATMAVLWMNEPAAASLLDKERGFVVGMPAAELVPVSGTEKLPDALRLAASSGEAQYVHVDVVSTGRGSMTVSTSVCPLPDGTLLVLVENAWLAKQRPEDGPRRPPRRTR